MKNLPHRISDLTKITESLRIASEVSDQNEDVNYSNEFAKLLLKNKIITGEPTSAKTTANGLRQFFRLLGFMTDNELTEKGKKLINLSEDYQIHKLWHESLLKMKLADSEGEGKISKPYKILVKLILNKPGLERYQLCLPLECDDDSDEEFNRIVGYLKFDKEELARKIFGNREDIEKLKTKISNAAALLPPLGCQIGDFKNVEHRYYPTENLKDAHLGDYLIDRKIREIIKENSLPKEVNYKDLAKIPRIDEDSYKNIESNLSEKQKKIFTRTIKHQRLVRTFGKFLSEKGYELRRGLYDCLAIRKNSILLIEAKTIKQLDSSDQRNQSEKGIGQIKGYFHFDLPDKYKKGVKLILLMDNEPYGKFLHFLSENEIIPIWQSSDKSFKIFHDDEIKKLKSKYLT